MSARALAALAVVAAVAAAPGSAASTADVEMPEKLYVPRHLDVLVGTTVTWRNTDRTTHTVTEDEDAFDSGHLRPGESFSWTFRERGTFAFHCTIHRFMRGSLSVYEVVLRAPDEAVRAGRRVRLEGVAPEGVAEVLLERVGPPPRTVVGRVVPDAEGVFSFSVRAPEPRSYVARTAGASSPAVAVRVAPRVSVTTTAGAVAVVARPPRPGSVVVLQRYERERFDFVTVARGQLDARSRAGIAYAPEAREHLRAVVRGGRGWADGTSRVVVARPR